MSAAMEVALDRKYGMKKSLSGAVLLAIIAALAGCAKASKDASPSAEIKEADAVNGTNEANGAAAGSQEENAAVENEMPANTSEYIVVNSPEGINVRETPDLSAQRIAGLADKTVVKLLQKGPETTIDAIASNWLEIELPEEIARKSNVKSGWVFGGYMEKNPVDSVSPEYFNATLSEQTGMASIGSYIVPKKGEVLTLFSAPSENASVISSFGGNDLGIIVRACSDPTESGECWYYILNQTSGKKGWVCSKDKFSSTADGFKMSETKQFYTRKNADVLLERFEHRSVLRYIPSLALCSDNIHYVARTDESRRLVIHSRNDDETKEIDLSSRLEGRNDREADAIVYSAKSNVVYFGWDDSVYAYSIDDDAIALVFTIDTEAPEALSSSLAIKDISVSKDERYFYVLAEFFTGRRYISRMLAYDSQTKIQRIIDTVTPQCDGDHYYNYSHVDFDEDNNAVYSITNSQWRSSWHVVENALVTVSSDAENWPDPVLRMLPQAQYSDKTAYLPGSRDVLCCDSRFCVYGVGKTNGKADARLKASYRFAENSMYDSGPGYSDFQLNEDKSICAVLEGSVHKYISFYSTKTFNLLFSLRLDGIADGFADFWWNGTMLLVRGEYDEKYRYSSFNISITEKENQVSDNDPLNKEQVGLCAKIYRCEDDGEIGYKFSFSPAGMYICFSYYAMSESEEIEKGVVGGYEVTGNNEVRLYPYFSTFSNPYSTGNGDFYEFSRFNLLPDQKGLDLHITVKYPEYNRFGDIYLYDGDSHFIGSTYDWDIGYGAYGVHFEDAASAYRVYGK